MSHTSACTVVPPTLLSRSMSSVCAPVLAAANAAPIPAGPAPTTTTSYMGADILLFSVAILDEEQARRHESSDRVRSVESSVRILGVRNEL